MAFVAASFPWKRQPQRPLCLEPYAAFLRGTIYIYIYTCMNLVVHTHIHTVYVFLAGAGRGRGQRCLWLEFSGTVRESQHPLPGSGVDQQ